MATETILDLIKLALKKARVLGTGDILSNEDAQDALDTFNMMLDSWSLDGLFLYAAELQTFNLTGAQSYTIGPGGDFSQTRPIKITSAYAQVGQISYPIEILDNANQYDSIWFKSLGNAWPSAVWYEQSYPLGKLHFWPASSATVNIRVVSALQQFPALATVVSLPPGYRKAIVDAGAVELSQSHNTEISPLVVQSATNAIARLKRANIRPVTRNVEASLMSSRCGGYGWPGEDSMAGGGFITDTNGAYLVIAP